MKLYESNSEGVEQVRTRGGQFFAIMCERLLCTVPYAPVVQHLHLLHF